MRAKRVVLLSNRSLLASGVQRLLQSEADLEFSIVYPEQCEAGSKMELAAPDIIVLDAGAPALAEGVIVQLLADHPRARVVALDVNAKSIDVYRVRRIHQTNLEGLLTAISGRVHPGRKSATHGKGEPKPESDGGGHMGP